MKTRRLIRFAAAIVAVLATPIVFAADLTSPVGRWQLSTGESRYTVIECGEGAICAKLTWLRDDARTAENLELLNTFILKGARKVTANKWQGSVVYEGDEIDGSVTLVDANTMRLTGCQLLCQSFEFSRL